MNGSSHRTRFWAYAASFGALWGAFEGLVGVFLHALRIPFTGLLLASLGALILAAQRRVAPWAGISLATGLIAAFCRAITPSTVLLGPLIGILTEALLIECAFLMLGRRLTGAVLGGFLAALWSISQGIVMQVILYGAPVVDLAFALAEKLLNLLGVPPVTGWAGLGILMGLVGTVGAVGGFVGSRMGNALEVYREALLHKYEVEP